MEWGSVAEWVGAIGTAGALLLGLGLLARERTATRRQPIDDLVTWLTWRDIPDRVEGVRRQTSVHILNSSTRAMHAPLLFYPGSRGGYGSEILSKTGEPAMLPPGSRTEHIIQGQPRRLDVRYVRIAGSDGRTWIRRVDEHRYVGALGSTILELFLLIFERTDGSSARRRRARAVEATV